MRPRTAIMLAPITTRRNFSNTCGQTTRLAIPVSSSRVMNINGMSAERQTHMAVVLHDLAAGGHQAERGFGFIDFRNSLVLDSCSRREQREEFVAKRLDRPKGFAP